MKKIWSIVFLLIVLLVSFTALEAKQKLTPLAKRNLRNANIYLQQKIYDKAMSFYQEVLKESPDCVEALKNIGDLHYYYGTTDPTNAEKNFSAGYGYYKKVLEVLKTMNNLDDDEIAIQKDSEKKLESCYVKIFKIAQDTYNEKDETTDSLAIRDIENKTITTLNVLTTLDKDKTLAYKFLLSIYQNQKNEVKVEETLNFLIAAEPNSESILKLQGAHLYNTNKKEEALAVYNKVNDIEPNNPETLALIARIQGELERYKEAMVTNEKVLSILKADNPAYLDALYNGKSFAGMLKNKNEEIEYAKKIVEVEGSVNSLDALCLLLASDKKYAEMIPYAERLYAMDTTSKNSVQYIIYAATVIKDQATVKKYKAILDKMK